MGQSIHAMGGTSRPRPSLQRPDVTYVAKLHMAFEKYQGDPDAVSTSFDDAQVLWVAVLRTCTEGYHGLLRAHM